MLDNYPNLKFKSSALMSFPQHLKTKEKLAYFKETIP